MSGWLRTIREHRTAAFTEAVREAIDKMIDERRQDEEFQARLRAMIREDQEILERLAQ